MSNIPSYEFSDTNDFGTLWEIKMLNKLQLVFPELYRPDIKNSDGDIYFGNKPIFEVKAETNSAESKRCYIECQKCINHRSLWDYDVVPSGLYITKSKYYIHVDTDEYMFVTHVHQLIAHVKSLPPHVWEYNAKFNQGWGNTYFNCVYVQYSALRTFSLHGYYKDFGADVIKKYISLR